MKNIKRITAERLLILKGWPLRTIRLTMIRSGEADKTEPDATSWWWPINKKIKGKSCWSIHQLISMSWKYPGIQNYFLVNIIFAWKSLLRLKSILHWLSWQMFCITVLNQSFRWTFLMSTICSQIYTFFNHTNNRTWTYHHWPVERLGQGQGQK